MSPKFADDAVAGLAVFVTVEELVVLLRTSRRQIYRLISTGRLPAVKQSDGGSSRNLVPRVEVHKYLCSLVVE
ncbi:MAG TPA: helix-turn-helix domain-containing protein [Polyangiaceae bacterium]|jgi:excisionase family DNA binding protein|nr:helix-turn-helix domain-containing protein [Polyangiaceae bacterium]